MTMSSVAVYSTGHRIFKETPNFLFLLSFFLAAVLFVPSPSLDGSRAAVRKLAMELGIPIGGYNQAQDDIVYSYTIDKSAQGKQAARLANQIFKGTNPGGLPVETGEFFLIVNLKTAQTIGLNIPDDILRQADTVIR